MLDIDHRNFLNRFHVIGDISAQSSEDDFINTDWFTVWTSNHVPWKFEMKLSIHSQTYDFEVWEWISIITPHIMAVIT